MERRWFIGLILFACAWFVGRAALAGTPATPSFTYEGYLEEDSGGGTYQPVNGTRSVSVAYYGNSGVDCKLYQETHSSVLITEGHFAILIGKGSSPTFYGSETSLSGIQEARTITGSSCSFNAAAAGASRFLRIAVAGTPMGDVAITSAPMAMVADSVQGLGKSGILQVNASSSLTQAALENFMQTITGNSNQSVVWTGSSFASFDPNDGSTINTNSIPDSAIAGLAWSKVTSKPAALVTIGGLSCASGEIMKMVSGSWACATESGGGGSESDPTVQTYAKSAPGSGLKVSSGVISVDVGTAAGQIAAGDDSRFSDSRAPNGSASGDLSGNYPSPTVAKLNGKALGVAVPLENDFLTYNATGQTWNPTGFLKLNRQSSSGVPQALIDTSLDSYGVPFLVSGSDQTIHAAHKLRSDNVTNANSTYGTHFGALSVITQSSVNAGITNPGGHVAGNFESYRNYMGNNNDGGTIDTLLGVRIFVGHDNSAPVSPTTNEAVGLEVGSEFKAGTVGTYKAVRIGGANGTSKPADANSYGIYQESQNMRNYFAGPVGIGTSAPSAYLHLPQGSASAGKAPLKMSSGTLMTTPEGGAMEYDGTDLYFTSSVGVRKNVSSPSMSLGSALSGIASISNSVGNISLNPASGSGSVNITSGAASTYSGNGALVVSGGVGVGGDLNVSGGFRSNSFIQALYSSTATSGANVNSSSILLTGSYWNGSSSVADTWSIVNALGSGAAPSSTLTFGHTGSTGPAQYAFLSGKVGIGTSAPAALHDVIYNPPSATAIETAQNVSVTGSASTTSSSSYTGTQSEAVASGAGPFTGGFYANKSYAKILSGAGNVNQAYGLIAKIAHGSSSTTNESTALLGSIAHTGTGAMTNVSGIKTDLTVSGGGTISTAKAINIVSPTITSGNLTNYYGLYIEAPTSATNNYAIYSGGGANIFKGKVSMSTGGVAPTSQLTVHGGSTNGITVCQGGGCDYQGRFYTEAGNDVVIDANGDVDTGGGNVNSRGNLVFKTAAGSNYGGIGVSKEQMRIMGGGNVGIGTNNPAQKLDVAGQVQAYGITIQSGAATGKVLTSDASGNGTWQNPVAPMLSRFAMAYSLGSSSTMTTVGGGTATNIGTPSSADSVTYPGIKYTPVAVAIDNQAGVYLSTQIRTGWNPVYEAIVTTDANTNNHTAWAGMSNAVSSASACSGGPNCGDTNTVSGGYHVAAFKYSSFNGDFGWQCILSNGSSTISSSSNSPGVTQNVATTYILRIELKATDVHFYVNGVEVCSDLSSNSSYFPGSTMSMMPFVTVRQKVAAARTLTIHRLSIKSN